MIAAGIIFLLFIAIVILYFNMRAIAEECQELKDMMDRRRDDMRSAEVDALLMDRALTVVLSLEKDNHSGEWKFCEAYRLLTKNMDEKKWRAGLAIQQAVAMLRRSLCR